LQLIGSDQVRILFRGAAILAILIALAVLLEPSTRNRALVVVSWLATGAGIAVFEWYYVPHVAQWLETMRRRQHILGAQRDDICDLYRETETAFRHLYVRAFIAACPGLVLIGYVAAAGDATTLLTRGPNASDVWREPEAIEFFGAVVISAIVATGASWMAIVGVQIFHLATPGTLRTSLEHPDGCGGFEPLGTLCVWNGLILSVPFTVLVAWAVGAERPNPVHFMLAAVVGVLGLVAFLAPVARIHLRMDGEVRTLIEEVEERHAPRVQTLSNELLTVDVSQGYDKYARIAAELERSLETYQRPRSLPTWPINTRQAAEYLSSQVLPVAGLAVGVLGQT
jgi:hypothetical protein